MARVWIDHSAPRTLVSLSLSTGTGRYASVPVNGLAQPYLGRLLEEPIIRRRIVDVFWGPVEIQEVTVRLANLDGFFTAEYVMDLRGRSMTIDRHDVTYGTVLSEWVGQVEEASLTGDGVLEIQGTNLNLAIFDQDIPRRTVETSSFPLAIDVGMRIPVAIGNVPRVRLPYVQQNLADNFYDYVIEGPVTFAGLWRNGPNDSLAAIQASEYSVSQTLYTPALTTVRFAVQQVDFQGAPHEIYADVLGFQTERHFVRAVQRVLSDTVWGLGQTIDVANFNAAATALDTATGGAGGLLCDGALIEVTKAKDILRQLLMVRGMRLGLNASGQWQITVDTAPGAPVMTIRDGPGAGERNLLNVQRRTRVPASDRPRIFTLAYRFDLMSGDFLFRQTRTLDSVGREVPEDQAFIRDHLTADKVTDYLGKRHFYGQQTVEGVEITPAARPLVEGNLVYFTYAPLGYTDEILEVREVEKGLDTIVATLAHYASAIHTYTPGILPADNISGTFTDLARTPPGLASALSVIGSGSELGSDGGTSSWLLLQYTTPTINCTGVRIDIRKNGETVYQQGWALSSSVGANQQTRLRGLVPGIGYDIHVVTINGHGLVSAGTTLLNQGAPGDATTPATPTGLVVTGGTNRTLFMSVNSPVDRDIKGYEFLVTTAPDTGGTGVLSGSVGVSSIGGAAVTMTMTLDGFTVNTTNHIQVRAFDFSGNLSGWSASAPFVFAAPGAPVSVSITGWTVEMSSDGKVSSTVLIQCTAPSTNVAAIVIDYTKSGDFWAASGAVNRPVAANELINVYIKGLVPGLLYDFRVKAVSALQVPGPPTILANVLALGDITTPPIPDSLGAYVANRAVHVSCGISAVDLAAIDWEIRTAANGGGTAIATGSHTGVKDYGAANTWAITAGNFLAYGTTYHLRVRAVDHTGNRSAYSTLSVPFTYTTQDTPDITINAISDVGGNGFAGTTSWTAAGIGTWVTILEYIVALAAGSPSTDDLMAFAGAMATNSEAVNRLCRARLLNETTGAASVPSEATIESGQSITFTCVAIDGVPAGGSNKIWLQLAMEGIATHAYGYSYIQATKLRR